MNFNKIFDQLNEALSEQPIFAHDKGLAAGYNKWVQIKNAKLLSNETVEIYLEDGSTAVMNLRSPNSRYCLSLNDGSPATALDLAGIYGLLQPAVMIGEDNEEAAQTATPTSKNTFGDGITKGDNSLLNGKWRKKEWKNGPIVYLMRIDLSTPKNEFDFRTKGKEPTQTIATSKRKR